MLGEAAKPEQNVLLAAAAAGALTEETRPYIAVASSEGLLVNEHLGEAEVLRIYGWDGQMLEFIGERRTPAPGSGPQRWFDLADLIHDCRALLVSGVGPTPQAILRQRNIRLVIMEGLIEPAACSVFQGEEVRAPVVAFKCGARCEGDGKGCA
jgi:nitrogen fixation protein NifB